MKTGDLVVTGRHVRLNKNMSLSLVGVLINVARTWKTRVKHYDVDEHLEERKLWKVLTCNGVIEELESRMIVVSESQKRQNSNW